MQTSHARHDTTSGPLGDPRHHWRIPDDRPLPALGTCADDVRRLPTVTERETLWDTAERTLAFAGTELLRGDSGAWTVDRGDGPETPDTDDPVGVLLGGAELRPVRVRVTATTLVELRDRDRRVRAEVADVRIDEGDTDTTLLRSARWWALSDGGAAGSAAATAARSALTEAGRVRQRPRRPARP